ncbi:MAG TPA: phosphoribosylglycinamide formyltransferase [Spirochaetota bacterium]|nr:phosphoribosylglycinamide formyltransferase [Spirochaetota bacterium]HPC39453.1 phosphoribosylglycinamide formyltransferase [Spirochaetota bacterium]HPL15883.1 phosphoribosylglycinamide formyltransferase [Spirochaetota bacterium]HQF06790.1 phosphoribosylglycinamide formyltransferase [Spirochaetota bacterium]HQH95591.1 phosphoribosylglycinamide formyltransferase [Spirochaetota bacterium]
MAVWRRKKVISFLVSGSGLIFSSVAQKITNNEIKARTGCVVTDNASAQVLIRARKMKIPAFFIDPERYASREEHENVIIELFEKCGTDLIVTAGYLRLLSRHFVSYYRDRIINIHPSLLPAFPGIHSQRKALEHGVKITGCTAHFIDEGIDTGPIIMQRAVMVLEHDTEESLSSKILQEEYNLIAESVKLFCEDRLEIIANKVAVR